MRAPQSTFRRLRETARVSRRRTAQSLLLVLANVVIVGFCFHRGWSSAVKVVEPFDGKGRTWEVLPRPPALAESIADAAIEQVTIRTKDGALYSFKDAPGSGWVTESARPASPAFAKDGWNPGRPPGTAREVVRVDSCQRNESCEYRAYAVVEDGTIWRWRDFDSGILSIMMLVLGGLGGSLGLALGALLCRALWSVWYHRCTATMGSATAKQAKN